MDSVLGVMIVLLGLFMGFDILGAMAVKKLHIEVDFCGQVLLGFLVFTFIFVVIDVPMEIVQLPFDVLAYLVMAAWIVAIIYSLYKLKRIELPSREVLSDNRVFGMLLVVGAEIWYGMKNAIYTSHSDAAYYNMSSLTAIYTNTIFEYDQFSGFLGNANTRAQDSYIMLVAVLSKMTNMHVLVMINRVLAIVEIVLFNMLLYEIALLLSKKNHKLAFFSIPMYAVISLYYWISGGETLLWGRLAETKSMLANVYIPLLLFTFLLLTTQRENKKIWYCIMCAVMVGGALSFSGTYIMLAYAFFLALPYWLMNGRQREDIKYALCAVAPATLLMVVRTFL